MYPQKNLPRKIVIGITAIKINIGDIMLDNVNVPSNIALYIDDIAFHVNINNPGNSIKLNS